MSTTTHKDDATETDMRVTWPMGHDLRDPTVMNAVVKENLYTPVPSPGSSIFASGLSFVKDGFQDVVEVSYSFLSSFNHS